MNVGQVAVDTGASFTDLGDWGANRPSFVTFPLHGALHLSNIPNNVVCHSSSPLRGHKTSGTEYSTEFWSNRTKETRNTKDGGGVVTPVDDLG